MVAANVRESEGARATGKRRTDGRPARTLACYEGGRAGLCLEIGRGAWFRRSLYHGHSYDRIWHHGGVRNRTWRDPDGPLVSQSRSGWRLAYGGGVVTHEPGLHVRVGGEKRDRWRPERRRGVLGGRPGKEQKAGDDHLDSQGLLRRMGRIFQLVNK